MALTCTNCTKENRDIALFCKYCGSQIKNAVKQSPLDVLVGCKQLKEDSGKLVNTVKLMKERAKNIPGELKVNMHALILGNTGTGKTAIATHLQKLYFAEGITKKPNATIVDAVDFATWMKNFDTNIKDAKGGILFIDNAQKLLPGNYADSVSPIDKLFTEMDKFGSDPIVILSGLPGGFESYLENNPSVSNRFKYRFTLPDYTATELTEICKNILKDKFNLQPDEEAGKKLSGYFKLQVKKKGNAFGNAHLSVNMAEEIFKNYIDRIATGGADNNLVIPEDIHGEVIAERSLEEIMAELDDFIGMEDVKLSVKEIARNVAAIQERKKRGLGSNEKISSHIVLTGNPGTGKTTIARKLGEIFEAIGFLESGHVIEVDRSKLVASYIGQTPKQVNEYCDKAMGGILFVDEAYTLVPQNAGGEKDKFGTEAVETLMKRMEDDRDKFVVIAAGYKNEMEQFLDANPGMKSRIDRYLHIEDYKPDELFRIFGIFVKKSKLVLSTDAEETVKKKIRQMVEAKDKSFGNGREMRRLYDETMGRMSNRLSKLTPEEQTNEAFITILSSDIPIEEQKTLTVEECLSPLQKLTGLSEVKNEVTNLVSYLNIEKQRMLAGGEKTPLGLHFVFSGNPGTGKTTVARIMANIFHTLGLLPTNKLIEADKSLLVAGFIGQTAIKTNQLIDKAMGGVLFIDEAYTLTDGGSNDSFGKEAIDTLLKRMEDDRGKFIVIAAGYTNEMERFLDANPGLRSRFNKKIEFSDYKPAELSEIFRNLVKGKNMQFAADAADFVPGFFEALYKSRDKNFGNAREVRKTFDLTLQRQSARLTSIFNTVEYSPEKLNIITREDIEGKPEQRKTTDEIFKQLDALTGMADIKKEVRDLANLLMAEKRRAEAGGQMTLPSLHYVFTGNPGTGKTTVARIMAGIFNALEILPSPKLIEADRSMLVAGYVGQTAIKTNELIDRAMGGVLFIDEAYTLSGNSGSDFGKEAIDTLLKRMEDDRGKFIVIVAGYTNEMNHFISTNPGLQSRFTRRAHFPDYNPADMVEIFTKMVTSKGLRMTDSLVDQLPVYFQQLFDNRDENFGNARTVRNIYEQTLQKQSSRIAGIMNNPGFTNEMLNELTLEDLL